MRVLIYCSGSSLSSFSTDRMRVEGVIRRIAQGTDTKGLVVAVHLSREKPGWSGALYPNTISKAQLSRMRGPWQKAHQSGIPPGLPESFFFIEVFMGINSSKYPCCDDNQNGFKIKFRSFHAHLAYIFAHELHHYRRYRLGLHKGEGERRADRWAVSRVCEVGYDVKIVSQQTRERKRRRGMPGSAAGAFKISREYWNRIKSLRRWSLVRLEESDNRRVPPGSILRFIRPMRGSYRALVLDHRGDERVVPIEWLRIVNER